MTRVEVAPTPLSSTNLLPWVYLSWREGVTPPHTDSTFIPTASGASEALTRGSMEGLVA